MSQLSQPNSSQSHNQPSQSSSTQPPTQPPPKKSILSSWIIIMLILITIVVNIWAGIIKQELVLIIIGSILTGLSLILALCSVFQKMPVILRSTWRPAALFILSILCLISVPLNIYFLTQYGRAPGVNPPRTVTTVTPTHLATPTLSATPTDPATIAQIFAKPVSWGDNLDGANQDGGWDITSNSNGDGCAMQGHYQITVNTNDAVIPCFSNKTVTNFALEFNMTVLKGDGSGGLIFRAGQPASINVSMYRLNVNPSTQTFDFLEQQNNAARTNPFCGPNNQQYCWTAKIQKNQKNTIAVVALGDKFYIYINGSYVSTITDNLLSSGLIGLFATKHSQDTTIKFDSLELWNL